MAARTARCIPLSSSAIYARIARDRSFIAYALAGGVSNGSLYAYVTGSPHVFIDIFHIAPQHFGWFFAVNAFGLIGTAQIAARLVHGRLPKPSCSTRRRCTFWPA